MDFIYNEDPTYKQLIALTPDWCKPSVDILVYYISNDCDYAMVFKDRIPKLYNNEQYKHLLENLTNTVNKFKAFAIFMDLIVDRIEKGECLEHLTYFFAQDLPRTMREAFVIGYFMKLQDTPDHNIRVSLEVLHNMKEKVPFLKYNGSDYLYIETSYQRYDYQVPRPKKNNDKCFADI